MRFLPSVIGEIRSEYEQIEKQIDFCFKELHTMEINFKIANITKLYAYQLLHFMRHKIEDNMDECISMDFDELLQYVRDDFGGYCEYEIFRQMIRPQFDYKTEEQFDEYEENQVQMAADVIADIGIVID